MKRLQFICDGCDLTEYVTFPGKHQANFMFEGWVAFRVTAQENDAESYEISSDLCPRCAVKMRHAVNPANWSEAIRAAQNDQTRRAVI
jgi:hypothetical protein